MPCPSPSFSGSWVPNWQFVNWSARVRGPVATYCEPDSVRSLVRVVVDAAQSGRKVRAAGSLWSMENVAYSPDTVVSLRKMPPPNDRILRQALTPSWQNSQNSAQGDKLAHLGAGLTIEEVNAQLDAKQLAMISLGGANGQTLGGAISTGTHGGDWDLPPLADLVMAIHLIGPSGRQYWIERDSSPITDEVALRSILGAECDDTEIIYNDTVLNAALVSVGRFGIVCSYVIRVTNAFKLVEWTASVPWVRVRSLLQAGVQSRTLLEPLFAGLPIPPANLPALKDVSIDVGAPTGLEIVINTVDPANCFVRRRWPVRASPSDVGLDFGVDAICAIGTIPLVALINAVLDKAILSAAGGVVLSPVGTAIAVGVLVGAKIKFNADLHAIPNLAMGDVISLCFNTLWDVGLGFLSNEIQKKVFEARYADSLTKGRRGPAYFIKTGSHDQNQQNCYRADSVEPAFDAWSNGYLDYIDGILTELPRYRQSGYLSIRFSACSRALLSMHNFRSRNAVSVETTSLRSLKDNASWMTFLEQSCLQHGGRPHWGQQNSDVKWLCHETLGEVFAKIPDIPVPLPGLYYLTRKNAAGWSLFGNDLADWRSALLWVSDADAMFSNAFTTQRFLEPIDTTVALDKRQAGCVLAAASLLLA